MAPIVANNVNGIYSPKNDPRETITGALNKNILPHNIAENINIGFVSSFIESAPHDDSIPNEQDTEALSIRQK